MIWKGTAGSQLVDTNCRCNWSLFCFRPSQIVLSYTGNKLNFFSLNLLGCDIVAIYETMDEGWVLDNIQFLLEILCHLPYKGSTFGSGTTTQQNVSMKPRWPSEVGDKYNILEIILYIALGIKMVDFMKSVNCL